MRLCVRARFFASEAYVHYNIIWCVSVCVVCMYLYARAACVRTVADERVYLCCFAKKSMAMDVLLSLALRHIIPIIYIQTCVLCVCCSLLRIQSYHTFVYLHNMMKPSLCSRI